MIQGSMRIGFTFKDPKKIDSESLPAQAYPDLAQKPGFWIKPLHDKLAQRGNVITYMVDSSGDVFYSINGENKGLFFSGVDVSGPLWLVVDICGSTVAVKFVDEQAVADAADKTIREGDLVKLEVDSVETLTLLQDRHGGLGDMEKAIGDTGVAIRIDDDEDVSVLFQSHERVWRINPAALQKIGSNAPSDMIREGDLVMIGTDMERIKSLQKDHGEWVDDMKPTLGRIGRVTRITHKGTLRVSVGGKTWTYNAEAVRKMSYPTAHVGAETKMQDVQTVDCVDLVLEKVTMTVTLTVLLGTYIGFCSCSLMVRGEATSDGTSSSDSDEEQPEHGMAVGDIVKVDTDVATFRILQEASGMGWDDEMENVLGMEGTVSEITAGVCILVQFPNDTNWPLVPGCLTKIKSGKQIRKSKGSWLQKGALVRIVNDKSRLKMLQEGHGGYNDDMQACLGKTGYVLETKREHVKVEVTCRSWWFNPAALSPVELAEREELEALHQLREGDFIKVDVDAETFKTNQMGHGGFVEKMAELVEKVGMLHHIDIDGDAVVYYPDGTRWCINHMSLGKVDPEACGEVDVSKVLEIGDWVKVESDKGRVRQVQECVESIRWQDGYFDAAGKVGQVKSFYPFNDVVRVTVEGKGYPLSPAALLTRATPEDLKEILGSGDISSPGFKRGDLVKIAVDEQRLKVLQDGHGGFVDGMDELIGLIGSVSFIDRDGDAYVRFSPRRLCFNPYSLTKVMPDEDTFYVGDLVLIESDQTRFKALQTPKEHGGYSSKMLATCGMTGRVLGIIDPKKVRVKVRGKAWIYNPDLVTRTGNPGLGTGDWKSATICVSGKHDWSTGRCLVCVTCGECTHYGSLCPARDKPDRVPGSLCGCGNGHAGCDDCGTCKTCSGETTAQAETDDREGLLQKLLRAGDLAKRLGLRREVNLLKTSESAISPSAGATSAAKKEISEVLKNMGKAIELMRKSKVLDSLEAVRSALHNDFIAPYHKYAGHTHRKLMGDHLANIDGAKIFMDYLKFLSSEVSKGESGDINLPLECLELLRTLLIHYTDNSFEFCRAVGRCGLLGMLLQDLFDTTKRAQTETLWPMIRSHLCILYNCARVQENQDYFSRCGATNILKPYLRNKDEQIRIIALSCLAFVVDEENLHLIRLNVDITEMIMSILNAAVHNTEHVTSLGEFQYTAFELVTMLSALVRNDENKQTFVTNGVLDRLIELSKNGNDGEKECAIMCIQRLAHSDHISNIIRSETKVEETLTAVKNDRKVPATIRDAAATTLQILEHGPPRLTQDPSAGQGSISAIKYSDLVVNEEVGKGGFGQVFKAYHKQWMMNVAVKKIKMQSREQSLRLSKALIEEAKFMHQARNAYRFIVPLYGVCVEEKFTALVMDLMENGSVGDLMSQAKPVPWALRWRILHETILGMNFLHSMDPQIIHHDLKVQNVLVDEDFHAKIADFGLAEYKKVTGLGEDEGGGLCGTITHIPPEYLKTPDKKAEEKFDVYSFGITIWEVLTGQRPYEDILIGLLIRMHVAEGRRPDMKKIPTDCDVPIELSFFVELMEQCWQQDPKKRPPFRALAEKVQKVTQQTNLKVAEAIQVVKTALGRREETIPKSFDRRWTSVRKQSGDKSDV
ncbi:RIPK4 [Branchiostoma lanceolatum]|uniref:RIPK4 protein n=1 Tax=Branchiostoma lanceolatum TaxID=7740 RepID=A0A8K0AJG8_BRALA|nr:RIPK4 [Branchiostoma lanceolatum]